MNGLSASLPHGRRPERPELVTEIEVRDERLERVRGLFDSPREVPSSIEFVDIAGLVAGASTGEGLGNRFLGHVREVDAIAHVVRCFDRNRMAPGQNAHDSIDLLRLPAIGLTDTATTPDHPLDPSCRTRGGKRALAVANRWRRRPGGGRARSFGDMDR